MPGFRDAFGRPGGVPSAAAVFADAVYRLVRRVPRGRVATYGQIAALLDRPRAARAVGGAMRECPADIPWHRIVNAQGGISRRRRASSMLTQRILLEQEGVRFRRGRVWLGDHRWQPTRGAERKASARFEHWRRDL